MTIQSTDDAPSTNPSHTRHLVLVCDSKRGLFIRDRAASGRPALQIEREFHHALASRSVNLGTSAPGRTSNRNGPTSAVEASDYHAQDKTRFITQLAHDFVAYALPFKAASIMIVAPPNALAVIRDVTFEAFQHRSVIDINKDLTKHPFFDIDHFLVDLLQFKKEVS